MKLIKEGAIEPRLYQETILGAAAKKNSLVVLPTGLGKTFIAAMLAAHRVQEYKGRVLFLAPTRPLVEQHCSTWKKVFTIDDDSFKAFTGSITPGKRVKEYRDADFIFATPQVIQNDIISKRISLEDVVLLVVDEAHRASGDYPYGFIAKKYVEGAKNPRILALTASPGSREEEIKRVCDELFIDQIEARGRSDSDVSPYVKHRAFNWIEVELPKELLKVKSLFENVTREYLVFLKNGGIIDKAVVGSLRKKQLLDLQGKLASRASQDPDLYQYLSGVAAVFKLYHTLELLETQGLIPLEDYLKKLRSDTSKAAQNLLKNPLFKEAVMLVDDLIQDNVEHPKREKLLGVLKKEEKSIVFAHYRSSVDSIVKQLGAHGFKTTKLIGQASGRTKGLTQKEQIKRLEEFREGKYDVLVATSVGEEGLDIPAVDHVVFYEPVPSAIRSIQRGGRTARHSPGRISVLVTKGTRDEAYYWSSRKKEQRMEKVLRGSNIVTRAQRTLDKYTKKKGEETVFVFADHRESGSGVLKELSNLDVDLRMRQLDVADFQVSERVGVERKTVEDFLQSLVDGRLLKQARALVSVFEKPIMIIEGESLYGLRNVHENAIRGVLASLGIDFGVLLLYSKDCKDTAAFINTLARREQLDLRKDVPLRSGKRPVSLREQQQLVIEALPNVGPGLAKRLLEKFGSVEKVIRASETKLEKIEKIGEKKAAEIRKVVTEKYVG